MLRLSQSCAVVHSGRDMVEEPRHRAFIETRSLIVLYQPQLARSAYETANSVATHAYPMRMGAR